MLSKRDRDVGWGVVVGYFDALADVGVQPFNAYLDVRDKQKTIRIIVQVWTPLCGNPVVLSQASNRTSTGIVWLVVP